MSTKRPENSDRGGWDAEEHWMNIALLIVVFVVVIWTMSLITYVVLNPEPWC